MGIDHATCATHMGYQLSCGEYDELIRRRDGCCHLCGARPARLEIDHDHSMHLGYWAVRGMLCRVCNRRVGMMEAGTWPMTTQVAEYLANPWYLNHPSTPVKRLKARRRGNCPECGYDSAIRKDGRPTLHWSRRPGKQNERCSASVQK